MDLRPGSDESVELDLLGSARPDPVPDASTVDAHREALTRVMQRDRTSPRQWPALRRVLVAAAAVPVLAGAAILATRSPGGPAGGVGELQLASSNVFYDAPRCGNDPPPDLTIPEGFTGPIDGPSPDGETVAGPDQLVRHWTSGSATVELRWYADPDAVPAPPEDLETLAALDSDGHVDEMVSGNRTLSTGREQLYLVYTSASGGRIDPCTWVQITVVDSDLAHAVETLNAINNKVCIVLGPPTIEPCTPGE